MGEDTKVGLPGAEIPQILWHTVDYFVWLFCSWISLIHEIALFWKKKTINYLLRPSQQKILEKQLENAESYSQWETLAYKLDCLLGNDWWRKNPVSSSYDHRLIQNRLISLMEAREDADVASLVGQLRGGLLRNLASIGSINMYNHAYSGTKLLIEDYINEVIECLEFVDRTETSPSFKKMDFFHDILQSYGRTALVLHGGSLFAFCHLGTVKGLYENNLLPNIICGTTAGAIIAAAVCSCHPADIAKLPEEVALGLPPLEAEYEASNFGSVIEGVFKSLYPPEIVLLERYVRDKLGDMTFEEAYLKSQRVLNITVSPYSEDRNCSFTGIPTLFNYLSTPNVLISSAVRCSIGTGILAGETVLLAKDQKGNIEPYYHRDVKFRPANEAIYLSQKDSPYKHLSELFNVNSYLVSLARPYFAPVLLSDFKQRGRRGWLMKLLKLIRLEVRYRVELLAYFGLISIKMQRILVDENIPGGFQVTIVPELTSFPKDFARVFDSHDISGKARHWITLGERGVWPLMVIIWARSSIEFVLENIFRRKRADVA